MRPAVNSGADAHACRQPLYDTDPRTGATIEVFHADSLFAQAIGKRGVGWFHWSCQPGCQPSEPAGPFGTAFRAYSDALARTRDAQHRGHARHSGRRSCR
jgi:hypothetical protein